MQDLDDTIAAIATPLGEGGIAVIRISGPASFGIADRLYGGSGLPPSSRLPGTFVVAPLHGADGAVMDEVLFLFMRGPRSYTTQDVVEIQSHGGNLNAHRILQCVLTAGARLAAPGEFTRRAFLLGRLDLTQAEAVLDLIRARSDRAAAAAVEQLEGGLSRRLHDIEERLIVLVADLEATLDFPDDELPDPVLPELAQQGLAIHSDLQAIISSWEEGKLLRDGVLVVITGRPNVGKSTLLNGLLETDRAIVSEVPGTTRDSIEETLMVQGIPVRLVDTAGLRDTSCSVEREGMKRTKKYIEVADYQILVIDGSEQIASEERAWITGMPVDRSLIILNKRDLGEVVKGDEITGLPTLETSLINRTGVNEVKEALVTSLLRKVNLTARPQAVVSERHKMLLQSTVEELGEAIRHLKGEDEEGSILAASLMRGGLDQMSRITGRTYEEALLDAIFSRFCVGK